MNQVETDRLTELRLSIEAPCEFCVLWIQPFTVGHAPVELRSPAGFSVYYDVTLGGRIECQTDPASGVMRIFGEPGCSAAITAKVRPGDGSTTLQEWLIGLLPDPDPAWNAACERLTGLLVTRATEALENSLRTSLAARGPALFEFPLREIGFEYSPRLHHRGMAPRVLHVCLQPLEQKDCGQRVQAFSEFEVETQPDGWLIGRRPEASAEQYPLHLPALIRRAINGRSEDGELQSAMRLDVTGDSLRPFLHAWIGSEQLPPCEPGIRYQVDLTYSIPAELMRLWLELPGERQAGHFQSCARISTEVQRSLRRWLGWFCFRHMERYHGDEALSVVAYCESRPFHATSFSDLTYDLLNSRHMNALFYFLPLDWKSYFPTLGQLLGRARPAWCNPETISRVVRKIRARPGQTFYSFLRADATLTNDLCAHAVAGRKLADRMAEGGPRDERLLHRFAQGLVERVHTRLRRLSRLDDYGCLAPLVIADVTLGLAAMLGRPARADVAIAIRSMDEGSPAFLYRAGVGADEASKAA